MKEDKQAVEKDKQVENACEQMFLSVLFGIQLKPSQ
jgi:hypothetical protein